jgi:uncharacterized protein YjdB
MSSKKRKLQLLAAFTTLFLLALGVGCKGFFQNPTLTTVTIGPQNPNIAQGSTLQMSATGTFDDGSTKTLTSGVFWSSSDDTVASINSSGVITGASAGTATITGSSGTVSGTTTATVSLTNVTAITISPKNTSTQVNTQVQYTAMATVSGQSNQVDVTAQVTWTSSDTTNITIVNGQDPAIAQVSATAPPETVTITATYASGSTNFTDTATLVIQ